MQNGSDNTPSISLLKSIKLNVLLYWLIRKLQENIEQSFKILVCSREIIQQFHWGIISPDHLTIFLMGCSAALAEMRE